VFFAFFSAFYDCFQTFLKILVVLFGYRFKVLYLCFIKVSNHLSTHTIFSIMRKVTEITMDLRFYGIFSSDAIMQKDGALYVGCTRIGSIEKTIKGCMGYRPGYIAFIAGCDTPLFFGGIFKTQAEAAQAVARAYAACAALEGFAAILPTPEAPAAPAVVTAEPAAPTPTAKIAESTTVAEVRPEYRDIFATHEIKAACKSFFIGRKLIGTYTESLGDFNVWVFGYPLLDKNGKPAHFLSVQSAARAAAEAYAACVALERIFALAADAYDETVAEQEQYMQYEAELEDAFLDNGEPQTVEFVSIDINGKTLRTEEHAKFSHDILRWAEQLYYTADCNAKITDLAGRIFYIVETSIEEVVKHDDNTWEFWGARDAPTAQLAMISLRTQPKSARRAPRFEVNEELHGEGYTHSYPCEDCLPF